MLEAEQESLSHKLEAPPDDPEEVQRLGEHYVKVQNQVEMLLAEWAALDEKLGS